LLDRTNFFIKEHVGVLKLSDTYDIIDPDTQQQLGVAQEKLSFLILGTGQWPGRADHQARPDFPAFPH
jgi:hypothetical protein